MHSERDGQLGKFGATVESKEKGGLWEVQTVKRKVEAGVCACVQVCMHAGVCAGVYVCRVVCVCAGVCRSVCAGMCVQVCVGMRVCAGVCV